EVAALNLLEDAVGDDARGTTIMTAAKQVRFAEIISGPENFQMLQGSVGQGLIRFAPSAEDAIQTAAGLTFLEQRGALPVSHHGCGRDQLLKNRSGKKGEERMRF